MSRRFLPFTRLSIVFILAIILSGGILTYFSINNISNLKELTEKRVIEEQQLLAKRFSIELQEQIEKVSAGIIHDLDQVDALRDSLIHATGDYNFIIQGFIIDTHGEFVFPNFIGIPENAQIPSLSARFKTAFGKGEKAEFAEEDLEKAEKHYLSCLSYASGDTDSVIALNATGRISVKLGQIENATAHYSKIILDYYNLSDRNGFPYVYYSLFHLLDHTNEKNVVRITPLIEFSLEKMEHGSIPLNFHTEEILILTSKWLAKHPMHNPEKLSQFNRLIKGINQQIQFVKQYGNELSGIVISGNADNSFTDSKGFRIVNSLSDNNEEHLLLQSSLKNTSGILLDHNRLFDTIIKAGIQDGLEFEYRTEFPSGYFSSTTEHKLSYSAQLIPYFPGHFIQVNMDNEDLITDLIKRRSWIYGIASILLLLAMMLGVVMILRDISREKKLATLRSDFISNVTHELKTPLTSIRMYAESLMMRRVKEDTGQSKYLSVIVNESERLKRMINNILEFSKMEKARQEYHPVEINLSEILQTAILDMNYWLEKKGFNIVTEIEDNVIVKADPEKFYQVYSNLLSNAIKYSGDSRNIYIRLFRNTDSVITEVEDNGIGIAEDLQAKIFEEFYRVESGESGNIAGTGLGLTVVKEIVEAHQGKIQVHSEIGEGSKFSVFLFQQ